MENRLIFNNISGEYIENLEASGIGLARVMLGFQGVRYDDVRSMVNRFPAVNRFLALFVFSRVLSSALFVFLCVS